MSASRWPSAPFPRRRPSALSADGFTLVETLVAMVTGLAVMLALFAILDFSVKQTRRSGDVVLATQQGSGTLTKLLDELHSTCPAPGVTPVLEESTPSELWFDNVFGEGTEPAKTAAFKHRIFWSESEKGGTLWDWVYEANGGSWPSYTYATSPATGTTLLGAGKQVLGEYVTHSETESGTKEQVPFFQYYKYATKPGSIETGKAVTTLTPITFSSSTEKLKEVSSTAAKEVAAVVVTFRTSPYDKETKLGQAADFSGQATFAFSTPAAESTVTDGPCQ